MDPLQFRPFYLKLTLILISIALISGGIYIGKDIIVPFALALLLAVLLRPVEQWMIRRGFPKVLAISMAVLLSMAILAGIAILISIQLSDFTDELPKLKKNVNDTYREIRRWIRKEFSLSYRQQDQYIQTAQTKTLQNLQSSSAIGLVTSQVATLILIPLYAFLLLYYRTMLIHFSIVLFAEKYKEKVLDILGEIKSVIQSYMVGLLLETGVVALLNSLGLLLLNVQYAILLGVMAAILNLVPYIGGLVATVLAVLITFINHPDGFTIVGVVGIFLFVQFLDNNILVPMIVGSKVRMNALASIIGVLIGGALAGISGMFLSIPAIAIMKVIFDRVEGMEPWGILLGDDTPESKGSKLFGLKKEDEIVQEENPPSA
jgi:predicted PurR-regulated permease PerM